MKRSAGSGKKPRGDAESDERLRLLVAYAVQAPSGHNAQPWLFKLGADRIDLFADRTRALPVVDPDDRALTISCGAALEHLALAVKCLGHEPRVTVRPGIDSDHLARVEIGGPAAPSAEERAMFEAVPRRRTTRGRFENKVLPQELRERCRLRAKELGVELLLIEDLARRAAIAELVAEGDRTQFADPRFRRELASWIHSRRATTRDGMSGDGFGMPDLLSGIGARVIRTFDLGEQIAAGDRAKIVEASPLLAVLATAQDEVSDWIAAGRALARVLLTLAASGATASFLNQPIEVETLRPRLAQASGAAGVPQLLMRFGYGSDVRRSVRRAVEDVLLS